MAKRSKIVKSVERDVLLASRRRCCLCVFLDERNDVRRGQIAHLNRNRKDSRFENLVFLCLAHHDEYDSQTSQSKAFTVEEVREYRNRLYVKNPEFKAILRVTDEVAESEPAPPAKSSPYAIVRRSHPECYDFTLKPWRFPLWQVANEPEYFAYKAANRADGICLIERIDIPDGRIVIVCIQTVGNPGNSITNCVEYLCFQVCERFDLPPDRIVWLEHYNDHMDDEWKLVTFSKRPPQDPFEDPTWTVMTPAMWRELGLRPKKRLKLKPFALGFESKVRKLFNWPTENLF